MARSAGVVLIHRLNSIFEDIFRCQSRLTRFVKRQLTTDYWQLIQFLGDLTGGVTPVPIPNTEVKPLRADGTAWATAWETRSLPGIN